MNVGIEIRKCERVEEFHRCVEIEREVWGESDLETEPYVTFVLANQTGGHVLGAFDGERMVGFTMAVVGLRNGQAYLHSHMTGVMASHRNRGVGRLLKLLRGKRRWGGGCGGSSGRLTRWRRGTRTLISTGWERSQESLS